MKLLLVGANDAFAKAFFGRISKEEYEGYFVSSDNLSSQNSSGKYKFFRYDGKKESMNLVMDSVKPDVVVFAGDRCMEVQQICEEQWSSDGYLNTLEIVLQGAARVHPSAFILLSSLAVYGSGSQKYTEDSVPEPVSTLGMCMSQGEYMANQYGRSHDFPVAVLRCATLYSDTYSLEANDLINQTVRKIIRKKSISCDPEKKFQLLHVDDCVDAVLRVMDTNKSAVYNVASSEPINENTFYSMIAEGLGITPNISAASHESCALGDCTRIRNKLEWSDFHKLTDLVQNYDYWKKAKKEEDIKKKKTANKGASHGIRKTVENLVIFAVFFLAYYFTKDHALFSTVDWMLIYVAVISVFWGLHQSLLAVVLASISYLLINGVNILQMANFYSYADCILMIAEFIFFGIVISYTLDVLRENVRNTQRSYELLDEDYQELKTINRENVLIKQEYEKRLLVSRDGISRLYAMVSKLMNTSSDVVMKEILGIVADMMDTNTVAVYTSVGNPKYLRLVNGLNKESLMEGKSWDISAYPQIAETVFKNQLFEGNSMEGEPAIVLPIPYKEGAHAFILIKELPYTSHTLYHTNMLRTLGLLISDSMTRALDYEELTRSSRYVKGTEIMLPQEFKKQIQLAQEKNDEGVASYSLLCLKENNQEVYEGAYPLLRTTDFFGQGEDGKLYVLLNNAENQDADVVMNRLKEKKIEAVTVRLEA